MRKTVLVVAILLLLITPLFASKFALSVGMYDALKSEEGLDAQFGAFYGIGPRWELEGTVITKIMPKPFTTVGAKLGVNFSLLGPVYKNEKEVSTYATMYVGAGVMGNFVGSYDVGPYIQITPVSVGGEEFRLRERTLTGGLYYNVIKNSLTFYWSLFSLDFFIK